MGFSLLRGRRRLAHQYKRWSLCCCARTASCRARGARPRPGRHKAVGGCEYAATPPVILGERSFSPYSPSSLRLPGWYCWLQCWFGIAGWPASSPPWRLEGRADCLPCAAPRPPGLRPRPPLAAGLSTSVAVRVRFPSWETGPPRFTFSLVHFASYNSIDSTGDFSLEIAVLPVFRLVPPWCILVQYRSVRPVVRPEMQWPREC